MSLLKAEGIEPSPFKNVLRWDPRVIVALVPLALMVLAALYAYSMQFTRGLIITGLNRPAYWGMYIVNFVTFTGLSGGGVIVAGVVHAFGLRRYRSVARIAVLMAIICILLALMFIILDLGRPDRLFTIMLHPHLRSPLVWDVMVVNGFLLICLAFFYLDMRVDLVRAMEAKPKAAWLYRLLALGYTDLSPRARARDRAFLEVMGMVGLVGAVALRTVSAWILGLTKARPGWFGAIMGPLFIVSATVSGLALLLVCVVALRRVLRTSIANDIVRSLGFLLAFSIPVLGYFLFAEMMTTFYGAEPPALRVFLTMMSGRNAIFFYGHLVVGLIIPFLLLGAILLSVRPSRIAFAGLVLLPLFAGCAGVLGISAPIQRVGEVALPAWGFYGVLWVLVLGVVAAFAHERIGEDLRIGIAAFMVTLGAFAERWNIVVPSLIGHSFLPFPTGSYVPSGAELTIVAGVYALGSLLFIGSAFVLPLVASEENA
jgi:molybdopterin-containing oxidoreductase family membrane subunit